MDIKLVPESIREALSVTPDRDWETFFENFLVTKLQRMRSTLPERELTDLNAGVKLIAEIRNVFTDIREQSK